MPKFQDLESYIPWDKSDAIRKAVLDIAMGNPPNPFFQTPNLGDDLQATYRCALAWPNNEPLHVGESATLLRNLRYLTYLEERPREFVLSGSLRTRKVSDNPAMIHESLDDLMLRDGGTQQWAAAALLLEYPKRIHEHIPDEIKVYASKEAFEHWILQIARGALWTPKKDATIAAQARAFYVARHGDAVRFTPTHSEDYCFARAFDLITAEEGQSRWGNKLANHETDRIPEMERSLLLLENEGIVDTTDHRIIQAMCMRAVWQRQTYEVVHPKNVGKTWPQFWDFLEAVK
ncbi:hypothetical protein J4464_06200 [Candidatus Woesearchaeota archaeon]|nr:hypothetical protein [Candidatus Woesearchaeota archaeon]